MSFNKAVDLLRLAELAAGRHLGVGLAEIEEIFEVDRRTAQRMTKALEAVFPDVETQTDAERRKYWKIAGNDLRLIASQGIRDVELAALEMSIRRAGREGAAHEAESLGQLRDRLLALMPGPHKRRAEADAEALLEAQGFASRPGPRVRGDLRILRTITEALRAPFRLTIDYAGARDSQPRARLVEPYGVLLGIRQYLVARPVESDGRLRQYRIDRITDARLDAGSFQRDPDFDLARHAARAFGSYHDEAEFGDTIWRFSPRAAEVARSFVFHPDQTLTDRPDGSLEVRFAASGHLEMAWHLYCWGDEVEVLAPEELRSLVEGHRRPDFPALP
jgi:predicted DNA-binding transcriptional regulator YafY